MVGSAFPTMTTTPLKQATITSDPYGAVPTLAALPVSILSSPQPLTGAGAGEPSGSPSTMKKSTPSLLYKLTHRSSTKVPPRGSLRTVKTPAFFEEKPSLSPDALVPRKTSIKKLNIEKEDEPDPLIHPDRDILPEVKVIPEQLHTAEPSIQARDTLQPNGTKTPKPRVGPLPKETLQSIKGGDGDASGQYDEIPRLLDNENYFTIPPLEELARMTSKQLSQIEDFVIGHRGIGRIKFPGKTDVRGLQLDRIIKFPKLGEVEVYPEGTTKPPIGQALNKEAIVTLEGLKPPPSSSIERYEQKIRRSTASFGGEFVSYDRNTGDWVFKVSHF
jgi:hypothetical protein